LPLDLVALEDIGWTFTPDPDATLGTAQQPAESVRRDADR